MGNIHGLCFLPDNISSIRCMKKLTLKLQSNYVMHDHVILKSEARVQIYVAVLNFGCEIQNSGGNVVSFSKINICKISSAIFI